MLLPVPLQSATLVRRYKRFLADCTLADDTSVTAHIADPGRLPGLVEPGAKLWLSTSDDPKRKLAHRVELIETAGALVGANTRQRQSPRRRGHARAQPASARQLDRCG